MRGRTLSWTVLTALGLTLLPHPEAAGEPSTPRQAAPLDVVPQHGTATFTDLTGGGACSFLGEPPDNLHVGLSSAEFGTAYPCGGYLDVIGPTGGTVRVKITDHCPRCPAGLLDLTRTAFAQIADVAQGRVPVTYQLVRNPPMAEAISLRVKASSSRWWMQIQALDHGNPIASFELRTETGWRRLEHTADNFWTAANPGPGDGPFTVRLTDIYGQGVTIDGVALAPDVVQPTGARLYPAGGLALPTPAPPTTVVMAPATTLPTPVPTTSTGAEAARSATRPGGPDAAPGSNGNDSVVPIFIVLCAAIAAAQVVALWRQRRQPRVHRW